MGGVHIIFFLKTNSSLQIYSNVKSTFSKQTVLRGLNLSVLFANVP